MFTGIAALAAGTVTTATVLAAVAEVGVMMSVVGAVTGSKSLIKIGGVLGIVGGVGGLVNGAVSGAGAAVGADVTSGVAAAAPDATGAISQIDAGISATDIGQSASGFGAGADASGAMSQLDKGVSSVAGTPGVQAPAELVAAPPAATPSTAVTQGANVGAAPQTVGNAVQENAANLGAKAPVTPADTTGKLPSKDPGSFFSGISSWIEKNPTQSALLGKSVLGGLQGLSAGTNAQAQLDLQKQRIAMANSSSNFAPRGIINGAVQA